MSDLDLPFENVPSGQTLDLSDAVMSGGLVVMAASLPVADGVMATLVFRFSSPVGEFYPPMVLALEDDQMLKLLPLITKAAHAAVASAEATR